MLACLAAPFEWFTPERRIVTVIVTLAICQGLWSITDLSISYLFKDDFHLGPAQVSSLTSLISVPWIVKPLYGVISDSYPILGYRRKSYIIIWGLVIAASFILLSRWADTVPKSFWLLFTISMAFAFNNVIGEALIVESAQAYGMQKGVSEEDKQKNAARNVSLWFGSKSVGSLIAAYFGGLILMYITTREVFLYCCTLGFIAVVVATLLPEKRMSKEERIAEELAAIQAEEEMRNRGDISPNRKLKTDSTLTKVMKFVKRPEIYKPIGFLFLFVVTPSAGSAMFYFYVNELGFQPDFMGQLRLASALASVVGIYLFNRFLQNVSFKKVLTATTIICCLLSLSQLLLVSRKNLEYGIPDKAFCLGDSVILTVFAEINFMPILILCCRICPKNIEGTMYALLMSISNFGGLISSQLGALLIFYLGITETDFTNLWVIILITSIFVVAPLPLLYWIEIDAAVKATEEDSRGSVKSVKKEGDARESVGYGSLDDDNKVTAFEIAESTTDEEKSLLSMEDRTAHNNN